MAAGSNFKIFTKFGIYAMSNITENILLPYLFLYFFQNHEIKEFQLEIFKIK